MNIIVMKSGVKVIVESEKSVLEYERLNLGMKFDKYFEASDGIKINRYKIERIEEID